MRVKQSNSRLNLFIWKELPQEIMQPRCSRFDTPRTRECVGRFDLDSESHTRVRGYVSLARSLKSGEFFEITPQPYYG